MNKQQHLTAYTVVDGSGKPIGIELKLGTDFFFITTNQTLWPGIRAGKFPVKKDGRRYKRKMLIGMKIF